MPRKKDIYDYEREFIHEVLNKKYGVDNVTPAIFKKEILSFMKKMDADLLVKNYKKFINDLSNDMVTNFDNIGGSFAKDKKMYPYEFSKGVLEKNVPSEETLKSIEKAMNKDAYVDFCKFIKTEEIPGNENNQIENKMNKFKLVERMKPKANWFTGFFKRLFNIGGYNDKLAAYNDCKDYMIGIVGNKLSSEEFERHIASGEHFSSVDLKKEVAAERIEVAEFDHDLKSSESPLLESEGAKEITAESEKFL